MSVTPADVTPHDRPDRLRRTAQAAVLDQARHGALPAFALQMGLAPDDWHAMAADALGGTAGDLVPAAGPPELAALAALMMANRSGSADVAHARWLAHAIAAASHGPRHLWQDLGMAGRDDVSLLMRTYFAPLFARNTLNLKWKRFLYEELGTAQGRSGLRPPKCASCEEFGRCFPAPISNPPSAGGG